MSEASIAAALRPFGWTCGPDFWARYYTDPWVFNLANAVEAIVAKLPADERNRVDAEVAEDNRHRDGGYTYFAPIEAGTTGVGFTVACLRIGDHAHLEIDSGQIVQSPVDPYPQVRRGYAGRLIISWHEWVALRKILALAPIVHIAEVERPTRAQLDRHVG